MKVPYPTMTQHTLDFTSVQQVIDEGVSILTSGNARSAYDFLAKFPDLEENVPVIKYLQAVALSMIGSKMGAIQLFENFLARSQGNDELIGNAKYYIFLLQQNLDEPIPSFPFGKCNLENIITLDSFIARFPERTGEEITSKGIRAFRLLNPHVIRPYGVVAYPDGMILAESVNAIPFIDISYTYTPIWVSETVSVPKVISLVSGEQDEDASRWRSVHGWKLKAAEVIGFDGHFIIPTHLPHAREAVRTHGVSESRLISAVDTVVTPDEVWFLENVE